MGRRFPSPGGAGSSGGGGGGSEDLPKILTDKPTLVDSQQFYIEGGSDYNNQSSTTYQAFHPLAEDGCFGGLFDPYKSGASKVIVCGFKVNPANGAIGAANRDTVWTHSNDDTFSTCHHGAVGNMVMNIGHNKSSSYGTTHKGTVFAASFNTSGAPTSHGQGEGGNWDMWPHSNGDLAMGANSVNGTMYGRRSTYYVNDSKYRHSMCSWNGSSATSAEFVDASADTSTNYCTGCAKSSKDDLTPGGMISWRQSNIWRNQQIYDGNGTKGSELTGLPSGSAWASFHLSNGKRLFYMQGTTVIGETNGSLTKLTTSPANSGFLQLVYSKGENMRTCTPTKNADEWIVAAGENLGFMKLKIDINDNYAVSLEKVFYTIAWIYSSYFSHSGRCIGLVGPNDEYLCESKVEQGKAFVNTYENPFLS